jgi:para-aminobenzoate synthetase component I
MSDRPIQHLRDLLPQLTGSPVTILLETQEPHVGVSYLASKPKVLLTVHGNNVTIQHEGSTSESYTSNAWDALEHCIATNPGWWFCALGYDLKNQDESLISNNPDPVGLPDLIAFQPSILVEMTQEGVIHQRLGSLDLGIMVSDTLQAHVVINGGSETKPNYLATIEQVKNDIHEGAYYELNLSHQLVGELRGTTYELYRQMAGKGPVPMASYIHYNGTHVLCASPERYLRREGTSVISEPIKGTRPRSADTYEDEAMKADLSGSEKERAENLMIVDLVRNDLSRVAAKGSVEVEKLFEIRSYATVHQMVSTVKAKVPEGMSAIEILRNTFPMGSMTGAPKIRVMQAIEEYETYRRGLYSGAIGYMAPNGDFDFNVVIRAAFIKNQSVWFPVGGAITADSDPLSEWEETLVKSRALPSLGN